MVSDLQRYQIVIIRPAGYVHSSAFMEVAETLMYAMRKMCKIVTLAENNFASNAINIVLGANLLKEADINSIPKNTIIYNFEQLTETSAWMTPDLVKVLQSFQVWEYSKKNIEYLKANNINSNPKYVPLGYVEELTRIPKSSDQDIDVLFYGCKNERRIKLLNDLEEAGLKVKYLFGVYGKERDEYIARSKVIVNIHFYETNIFELVRVSYLLANKKAVVSECGESIEIDDALRNGVALVPYEKIVSKCVELIKDEDERLRLEESGFELFSSIDECKILSEVLDDGEPEIAEAQPSLPLSVSETALPKKINIGSGKDFKSDFLNIDYSSYWNPDIVADLSEPDLLDQVFKTDRFGEIVLASNSFDEIIANDVLEHIPDLVTAMTNCLELLREGGEFKVAVPYDLSYGAWQDPTHVRAFNENSWLYYTDWFWYLGWKESRFDVANLVYNPSQLGLQLKEAGHTDDEIIRQPRAIDSMSVVLRKRKLTEEEKSLVVRMTTPQKR